MSCDTNTRNTHQNLGIVHSKTITTPPIINKTQTRKLETTIRFAIPLTFGFLVLLVGIEAYGLSIIPEEMQITSFTTTIFWVMSISIVFSLVVFMIVSILIKTLKQKTCELEKQQNYLEQIVSQKTYELLQAEKLTAIGELAARISHDIRNPLSVIMNAFEILKMKNYHDEKTSRHYEQIEKAIMRIAHQINDVLDYVKDNPLKIEVCLVSDLITEALDTIKIPEGIKLKIFDSDFSLECDCTKMTAVLKNLLLNSIQSINNEGKISIRVVEKHGFIVIEVEDSGSKIPEDDIPKIFDPLFTTKQHGTGLGLSICKKIIEKHGGLISARNNEVFGATFVIKVPKINPLEIAQMQSFPEKTDGE